MPLPIFFIDEILPGDFLTLSEETSRHVIQVLRMKTDEALQLTDGKGNLLTANISDEHKKKCAVRVISQTRQPKKEKEISIAISLVKNNTRFEWFLEKATEIGVTQIIPLLCARTEKQHFRFDRMKQIVVSAMLQSQQVWMPELTEPIQFNKCLGQSTFETKLIAHCEEEQKFSIKQFATNTSVQILIGPEGDFTSEEIKLAIENSYQPVTLGQTRLRTETAGVVAATLLCI